MADIDISVGVDDAELISSVNKAQRELVQLDKTADKTNDSITDSFDKSGKAVDEFTSDVKQAERAVKALGKEGTGVDKGLLKSLRGIRSEMRLFNTLPSVFNAVTGGLAQLNKGVEFYNETFNETSIITKKVGEATASVVNEYGKERSKINDLQAVLQGDVATREQKLQAIKQLQEINPELFKGLTIENALTAESATNYDKARQQLELLAKAKLRESLIGELRAEAVKKDLAAQQSAAKVSGGLIDQFAKGGGFPGLISNQITAFVETSAAETAKAAINFEQIDKAIEAVFKTTNEVIDGTSSGAATTKEGVDNLLSSSSKGTEKQRKENEALAGSIADIEKQLAKVNAQIKEQTVAGDTDALTPLVDKAIDLEKQLKAANDQLELLRNPPQTDIEVPNITSIGGTSISLEEKLAQEIALSEAILAQQQAAEMELLKSASFTEEQLTDLQAKQEKERQRLALETEQKRLEYALQYGALRTEAETQTLQAQLAAIKSELAVFGTEATQAIQGEKGKNFSLFQAFGLDPNTEEGAAQIAAIEQAGSMAIEQFQKLFDAQEQIAAQEVALRDKNIGNLQQQLANELELREQGFTSNVQGVQKSLQEEQEARDKALQAQKEARTAQFVLDTALQASSLITASAQIFQSFAALPFGIGVPIAVGVIGAMLGAFVAGKVKTAQAIKFNKGGRLPKVGEGGRSDEGDGVGHRVEDTNIFVGGGEHVVNAKESERHDKLLTNINSGKYGNADLLSIVEGRTKRTVSMQKNANILHFSIDSALERHAERLEKHLLKLVLKPQYIPSEGGYTEIKTDGKGNRTFSRVKMPKQ